MSEVRRIRICRMVGLCFGSLREVLRFRRAYSTLVISTAIDEFFEQESWFKNYYIHSLLILDTWTVPNRPAADG